MTELLQGAATPKAQAHLVATLFEAVPEARRATPTADEWLDTGRALARIVGAKHDAAELAARSFYLDVHIAVVCRKRGITLVTDDQHHARIKLHVGHATQPYPS